MVPDASESTTDPSQGPVEDTVDGAGMELTGGGSGIDPMGVVLTVFPVDEYVAEKPAAATLLSEVSFTSITPDDMVTAGRLSPEALSSSGETVEPPSYSHTKSYPASVLKEENERLTPAPVLMSQHRSALSA